MKHLFEFTCRVLAGSDITQAVTEAHAMSKDYDSSVEFLFNQVPVKVHHSTSINVTVERYNRTMEQRALADYKEENSLLKAKVKDLESALTDALGCRLPHSKIV